MAKVGWIYGKTGGNVGRLTESTRQGSGREKEMRMT